MLLELNLQTRYQEEHKRMSNMFARFHKRYAYVGMYLTAFEEYIINYKTVWIPLMQEMVF